MTGDSVAARRIGPAPTGWASRALPILPALTLLVMLGPVAAGLAGTLAPALGWTADDPTSGFSRLGAWPGLQRAVTLSLMTGIVATFLSLTIVLVIMATLGGTRAFAVLRRMLSPILSVPHAAAAFGLAFLVAPSGWIARIGSPWATGWDRPPDLLILNDPTGLALIAGLVMKEVPFLLLMALAAIPQTGAARARVLSRSLGYGPEAGWALTVLPSLYGQIRLPVYVVLAYSMTSVDVAIILGPGTPPPLAVQIVRWMVDPDLSMRSVAAAAAVLQVLLVVGALVAWMLGERAIAWAGRLWVRRGWRGRRLLVLRPVGMVLAVLVAGGLLTGLAGLALWSFAGLWAFPQALPDDLTLRTWSRHGPAIGCAVFETITIAAVATGLALFLVLGCLEAEERYGLRIGRAGQWLLYLPLLIPQVAFLPGLQILLLQAGLAGGQAAVIAAHVVFVLPYVFLSLGDPWRAWDRRHATAARALGASPDRVLWRVRLPMLLGPVLTAAAVGFAVSVGQYLPTLLIGGGRVATLTTEAVALAAGGDRRAIGATALAQTIAALAPFALALAIPRLVYAQRRAFRDA